MKTPRWLSMLCLLLSSTGMAASTTVTVFSGTFEGEHPEPIFIDKVKRGDRFQVSVGKVTALVNYPDRENPIITERVNTFETGAVVTCPWFYKAKDFPKPVKINATHRAEVSGKVVCDDGGCKDLVGRPIPASELLFGKYNLPKVQTTDGKDFGFVDTHWVVTPVQNCNCYEDCDPKKKCTCSKDCLPKVDSYPIVCQEFSVERTFGEQHLFEQLLILENYREEDLIDLDVDFRKLYLTFENERHERTNCAIPDLVIYGDTIQVGDLKDCVLPLGDSFSMYGQSRFFFKDTRACGKFVTKGLKRGDEWVPDWFMGWYECDGRVDRSPIEKQYTYSTRLKLKLESLNMGGK